MLTFTLVAILGILLVIVLMNLFKKTPPPAPAPPPEDLANLKVTDARAGDALSIAGAGDRMTDLDFTVEHATRMEAGSRSWAELTGPYQERRVALRVGTNSDEETEAYLHSAPGRISLDARAPIRARRFELYSSLSSSASGTPGTSPYQASRSAKASLAPSITRCM